MAGTTQSVQSNTRRSATPSFMNMYEATSGKSIPGNVWDNIIQSQLDSAYENRKFENTIQMEKDKAEYKKQQDDLIYAMREKATEDAKQQGLIQSATGIGTAVAKLVGPAIIDKGIEIGKNIVGDKGVSVKPEPVTIQSENAPSAETSPEQEGTPKPVEQTVNSESVAKMAETTQDTKQVGRILEAQKEDLTKLYDQINSIDPNDKESVGIRDALIDQYDAAKNTFDINKDTFVTRSNQGANNIDTLYSQMLNPDLKANPTYEVLNPEGSLMFSGEVKTPSMTGSDLMGGAGSAMSIYDAINAVKHGDTLKAVTSGVSGLVGGAQLANKGLQALDLVNNGANTILNTAGKVGGTALGVYNIGSGVVDAFNMKNSEDAGHAAGKIVGGVAGLVAPVVTAAYKLGRSAVQLGGGFLEDVGNKNKGGDTAKNIGQTMQMSVSGENRGGIGRAWAEKLWGHDKTRDTVMDVFNPLAPIMRWLDTHICTATKKHSHMTEIEVDIMKGLKVYAIGKHNGWIKSYMHHGPKLIQAIEDQEKDLTGFYDNIREILVRPVTRFFDEDPEKAYRIYLLVTQMLFSKYLPEFVFKEE